jgi:hypothetical protein
MQNDVNARMNWFERHLNWTAVIFLFGSIAFGVLLMNISTGWYTIMPLITRYRVVMLDIDMAVFSYGYVFLNAIIFTWILSKKNRSVINLLFFLPPLVFTYMGMFPWWRAENPNTQILIQWFGYAFILAGWIEVILLKNRFTYPKTTGKKLNLCFNFGNKHFKNIVLSLSSAMIFLSLFSFTYTRTGTSIFQYTPDDYTPGIPAFSFEYPNSFDVSRQFWQWFQVNPPALHVDGGRYDGFIWDWDNAGTGISILLFVYGSDNGTQRSLDDEALNHDWLFGLLTNPRNTILYPPNFSSQNIPFMDTTIDGKPARYITFTAKWDYESKQRYSTRSVYFFECNNYLWIISFDHDGKITQPPPYLPHLLETFKIYDE